MTEQPGNLAHEAKGIHQSLKELLKTKEPFDKDVDFQRKNLRRRYLNLLLLHPYAKESKDVENHLWMQTSYAFIASYKQRILNLDRVIQSKMRPTPNQRPPNPPIVEHRKLVQRFRQFLADEEKFWSQLVLRLRRSFALDAATEALRQLGIMQESDELNANIPELSDNGPPPNATANGRNHFQFPPEDPSTMFTAPNPEIKAAWLSILSKALVCLGDIARYRELYNESGGRPRAGQEESTVSRNRKNRRAGLPEEPIPRPRNYEKAMKCYEQARALVPEDGNPSHQLAIIATYRKDSFVALTHYYRALCVRTPYETASENLGSVLGKSLEAWKTRSRRERDRQEALPPRVQVEAFRENIVVLHSLWKVGMEKGVKKMESLSRRHSKVVLDAFILLVSQRYLPTDMITNAVVLSQGALWKHRMIRSPNTTQNRRSELSPPPEGTSTIIEWHMLEHLYDLHRGLLEVGIEELEVPPPRDAPGDDLAQRITATFRRCLPALRIASKWLRANFKYVSQDHEFEAFQEIRSAEGVSMTRDSKFKIARTSVRTQRLWQTYARFLTQLARKFDLKKLPLLTAPLDEDNDMRGFLPLKNMMTGGTDADGDSSSGTLLLAQEVHPNDWQLMRIGDLIRDAKEIAKLENSPITLYGPVFSVRDDVVEPQLPHAVQAEESNVPIGQQKLLTSIRDTRRLDTVPDEDNVTEAASQTDDDVIRSAFDFLNAPSNDNDVDDEEDKIVWDPRGPTSPVIVSSLPSPTAYATPLTHSKPLLSPTKHSPTHSKAKSPFMTPISNLPAPPAPTAATTAQDLLNDVISGRTTLTQAPQSSFLFGDLSHPQGHSIWSASHDEQSLKFASQPNQTVHQAKHAQGSGSFDTSQSSIWSSTYPSATQTSQNSQSQLLGALPPGPYPHQSLVQGSHQRVPSASHSASQLFPNQQYGLSHDTFAYSQPLNQQPPVHRSDALGVGLGNPAYLSSPLLQEGSNMYYQTGPTPRHHSHHPSHHDPRQLAQQYLGHIPSSSSSQLWGNVG
ncbi:hypothetical protein H0H92_007821 [Tricholoma furcatifolium]|nr:hypothetical protein H0H92_007821 [Tricholoma furcatifolium]